MTRAARLLDLVQILRRHRRPVTGTVLAEELGVSLRTLYRDIATLQAQGAPIEGEAGIGYVLKPGYLLPPLMFTTEEIEALVLGSQWVAKTGDPRLADAAREALARIGAVLPPDLRDALDTSGLFIVAPARPQQALPLADLRRALREELKIDIVYRDAAGAPSRRTIWPFALGFFETVRVVAAWCELREGFRSFRLDRITEATITPERYPRRRRILEKAWRTAEGIPSNAVAGSQRHPTDGN